jgi:phosphonate transport system permease protein
MSPQQDIARARAIAPEVLDRPIAQAWGVRLLWALSIAFVIWLALNVQVAPEAFGKGIANLGRFFGAMANPNPGIAGQRIFEALIATFAMAFIATIVACALALPLGLICARTVLKQPFLHFVLRRFLDIFRAIPALVWALILVTALGLGPLPGVLALILADIPNLAKLFAEAIENVDDRQRESVRATGAGEGLSLRFGVAPQVLPVIASQSLFCLEGNFRNAAVLGIVGAGGIGLELEQRLMIFAFDQVAYILIIYIICVMVLDFLSSALRRRLTQ